MHQVRPATSRNQNYGKLVQDFLKGFKGDTVVFKWRFKLDSDFLASKSFTHLHQIKAFDGDDDLPLITLTARKGTPDVLQVIHVDSTSTTRVLNSSASLSEFRGVWVEVYEKITYGAIGSYLIEIKRVSDGRKILSYSNPSLDMWRNGTTVVRPKWGIYRSLQHAEQIRDESVAFADFCLSKGLDDCA